jgi:phosphate transport system ATP-binding protein
MESGDNGPVRLQTVDLTAKFHGRPAVHGTSMSFRANTVTAIIGPSGCGKSTFLRCLNRMHEMSEGGTVQGQVLLDGDDVYSPQTDPIRLRKRIGMVFQKPTPFPTMSVFDNVAAGLRVNGRWTAGALQDRVERALRGAGLWDEVKDRLQTSALALSGGQQQRLCIARAVAPEPEVLLFDEPTSALDPLSTQRIEDLVQDLKREYTVVMVTHNMQQAARVSDYTAFFYLGEMVETGRTEDLFTNPKEARTEAYVTGRFG